MIYKVSFQGALSRGLIHFVIITNGSSNFENLAVFLAGFAILQLYLDLSIETIIASIYSKRIWTFTVFFLGSSGEMASMLQTILNSDRIIDRFNFLIIFDFGCGLELYLPYSWMFV